MQSFLEEIGALLLKEYDDISSLTIILPSKRAGGFLKNYFRKNAGKTIFSPKIISIVDFIETVSDFTIIDNTQLLFKSYEAYLKTESIKDKEEFESFANWIQTLLNDFNEIDRYLVDTKSFFDYLSGIKTLERWHVADQKTELIENYLSFWNSLPQFHLNLKELLIRDNIGYQGMVYRKAAEDIEHYIASNKEKEHVFVGFNALNNSEQQIIQALLETGLTKIYWDADSYFMSDTSHSASLFLRRYLKEWKYFKENQPIEFANNYANKKSFNLVEIQKNVGQAKYVSQYLSQLSQEELNQTAVVLADEHLLIPLLSSFPDNVQEVNITMGVPLRNFPVAIWFQLLVSLHQKDISAIYYKDVLAILGHPAVIKMIPDSRSIINTISQKNLTYISLQQLLEICNNKSKSSLKLVFGDWKQNSAIAISSCLDLLTELNNIDKKNKIEEVVLNKLIDIFNELQGLNNRYSYLKSVKSLQSILTELISTASLDFQGNAYSGLQVMGILETRLLDFERLIVTSVNEGNLPSGKSNTSFITYDLKTHYKLPSYHEKDAIYAYHFYRMLHRATNITLLYNMHSEGINTGEKSRFIRQLEVENHPNHLIKKAVVNPQITLPPKSLKRVEKTESIKIKLMEIAKKGFSPSALTTYIRNPIDFYYQKILGVGEFNSVEETVDYSTLGSIVHDSLQSCYDPFMGKLLTIEDLENAKFTIHDVVASQFDKNYKNGDYTKGKNLIIFEVAKRYVFNLISMDIKQLKQGNNIRIVNIEAEISFEISIPELDFPVRVKGIVDRVDELNGEIRIIDYKTGLVNQSDLIIEDWNEIITDYKYSKAFQVLAYTLMLSKEIDIIKSSAGIISFKNLSSGYLKFGHKPNGENLITQEIIDNFTHQLVNLITEICNLDIPFEEPEI